MGDESPPKGAGKFADAAISRFGIGRVLAIGAIGAVIIWAVAHFAAAPGASVSVLWGLVTYTKNKPSESVQVSAAIAKTPPPDETRRKAPEAEGQKGPLPIIRLSYPKEGQ